MGLNISTLQNLRNTLGTIDTASQNRGQFYIDLAHAYQAAGASSQAVHQLILQAQITTGSGQIGGAATLGNALAQQNAPAQYNVTLDTFSWEICDRLLTALELDVARGGTGILSAPEMHALDYSVWINKGLGNYFPGLAQILDDNTGDISNGSIIFTANGSGFIKRDDLTITADKYISMMAVGELIVDHASEAGVRLSDYGFSDNLRAGQGDGAVSANGQFQLHWDNSLGVYLVTTLGSYPNLVDNHVTVVIDPNASLLSEAGLYSFLLNGVYLGAQGLPLAVVTGSSEAQQILTLQAIPILLTDEGGHPYTVYIERGTPIPRDLIDGLRNRLGFLTGPDGHRSTGSPTYTGMPDVCFGAGTPILMADGTEQAIETIKVGDKVFAFDGNGDLVARRVTEVFENTSTAMFELNNGVLVTPDHPYLCADGVFRPIKDILGQNLLVVAQDSSHVLLEGVIMYASAMRSYAQVGANVKQISSPGWTTYNFTVEELHCYIAGGMRVHNLSILHYQDNGAIITGLRFNADGSQVLSEILPTGDRVVLTGKDENHDGITDLLIREELYLSTDASVVETYTHFDQNGKAVGDPSVSIKWKNEAFDAQSLGSILGSQIGQIIAGDNLFARIGAATVGSTILGEVGKLSDDIGHSLLGDTLNARSYAGQSQLNFIVEHSLDDLSSRTLANLQTQSLTVLSSLIIAEVADALHIDGFQGQVFTATGSSVTGQILSNLVNPNILAHPELLWNNIKSLELVNGFGVSLGTLFGSQLANEFINPQNVAESLFDSVGGTFASLQYSTAITASLGSALGIATSGSGLAAASTVNMLLGGLLLPGIGALIGTALGQVAGDAVFRFLDGISGGAFSGWFEEHPYYYIYDKYDAATNRIIYSSDASSDTTSSLRDGVKSLNDAFMETVNATIADVGGKVNPLSFTAGAANSVFGYHHGDSAVGNDQYQLVLHPGTYIPANNDFAGLMRIGVENELSKISFVDGDLVKVRAFELWKASITNPETGESIAALNSYLQTANDYRTYLEHTNEINSLIVSEPGSAFAAGWLATLLQAEALGLNADYKVGAGAGSLVSGTEQADILLAADGNDTINSGGGDDVIKTYSGNDVINAGSGNDLIEGGLGADIIDGGLGIDTVSYSNSNEAVTVNLASGAAQVGGDAQGDVLTSVENVIGSFYNDSFTGTATANVIDGGEGSDTVSYDASASAVTVDLASVTAQSGGSAAGDVLMSIENITGSAFNDVFISSSAANNIIGGAGVDTISYASSAAAVSVNLASNANTGGSAEGDVLSGIENIIGSGFNDMLAGSSAANVINGGAGGDTVSYVNSAVAVTVNLATNVNTGGDAQGDQLVSIENIFGSGFNDALTGDTGNNIITGGAGADRIDGGLGVNTASYAASTAGVNVNLLAGGNSGGDAEGDVLIAIQNIIGSANADMVVSALAANNIDGGAGIDTISYAGSTAVIVNLLTNVNSGGNAIGDVLSNIENIIGSSGNDALTGNAGDNIITGGAGADAINGGAGVDTVSYTGSALAVNVNLANGGAQTGGDAQGDTLISIENIIGSSGNDTLTGNTGNNLFIGGAGADAINGDAGIDTVSYAASLVGVNINLAAGGNTGGDANGDTLVSIENLIGSSGADMFVSALGANIIDGGAGVDMISYAASGASVNVDLSRTTGQTGGNAGGDILSNIENLAGSSYNDTLVGDAGDNLIAGKGGADVISGGAGIDTASYADSVAAVTVNLSSAGAQSGGDAMGDTLSGIENLIGSLGNDTLTGDAGDNVIAGCAGADRIDGGLGMDTVSYLASSTSVIVNLALLTAQLSGDAAGDILLSIENIAGSVNNDTLSGNAGNNTISGDAGNDTVYGVDGNDTLSGGLGADYLYGGNGDDMLSGGAGDDNLQGEAGNNTLYGDDGLDTLVGGSGNDTIYGGTGDDQIFAEDGNNVLYGEDGNDTIYSGLGNDVVNGGGGNDAIGTGAGDDLIIGGAGSDSIDGGAGNDTVSYEGSTQAVSINLATNAHNGGDASWDWIVNVENVIGSSFNDSLAGDVGVNILTGGDGADTLYGVDGNDTLFGGNDADQLFGGNGDDTLWGGAGNDTLQGEAGNNTLYGEEGNDTLIGGAGNDIMDGGEGDDNIYAEDGNNTVFGGAGNDVIYAGAGADVINGGEGADNINGGGGINTASYTGSAAGVVINLLSGVNTGGDAQGDTFTGIQNLIGSSYNDIFVSALAANAMDGGLGADTVSYAGSAAVNVDLTRSTGQMNGNAAGDILTSIENIIGSSFVDTLTGNASDNIITGGAGADVINGGAGLDTASYAGSSAVTVNLLTNVNTGGDAQGDNLTSIENIIGSAGNDSLTGSAGDNVITGGLGADTINGGAGNDTASYAGSAVGVAVNLLSGGNTGGDAQGDTLIAIENLIGSSYDDSFVSALGANAFDGGDGSDTVSYAGSAAVTVNLSLATAQSGGNAAGDILSGIENIIGSDYNDVFTGTAAANMIDGGLGVDRVSYAASLTGVVVNLTTNTNSGGDAEGDQLFNIENLTGSAYADIMQGSSAANMLDGGLGIDTVSYSASSAGVAVNLLTGATSGGDAQGDTLIGIENITGSFYDDIFVGSASANIFDGGAGSDTVSYAGSSAVNIDLTRGIGQLNGNAAGDILISIENITGSSGIDTLVGSTGDNIISGGLGADIINGGGGLDTASYAGSAAVTVNLLTGVNTGGDAQGDVLTNIENLTGSSNADTLTGNAGDNVIAGGAGADIIDGSAGTDTASYASSLAGVSINLVTGVNTNGDAQGDTLTNIENILGSANDDIFVSGAGSNVIDGGAGVDTVSYAGSVAAVTIAMASSRPQSGGNAAGDLLLNIENVTGTAYNDTLTGNAGDNMLNGGAGNDALYGGDGNDTLIGGAGGDYIDGNGGNNTASYASSSAGVNINFGPLPAVHVVGFKAFSGGDAEGDTLVNIQNVIGSAFADNLSGASDDNIFTGGGGADHINGGGGINTASYAGSADGVNVNMLTGVNTGGDAEGDVLTGIQNIIGSSNADSFVSAQTANLFNGGDGADTVSYAGSAAAVTVNLSIATAQSGGNAEGDILIGIENIIGSSLVDTLMGDANNNILTGGAGADIINGGSGVDTASYAGSSAVIVNLLTNVNTGGDAQGDSLTGIENVIGSAFVDTLTGDANANIITGGLGGDTINGGAGSDTASYAGSAMGVNINLLSGGNTGGDAQGDVLTSIENIIGSSLNDSIVSALVANIIDGGAGNDTVSYAGGTAVIVNLALATAQIGGNAAGDILSNIENIIGSSNNDTLTGDAGDNVLAGGMGADSITGGAGNDTVSYETSAAGVTVNLSVTTAQSGGDAQGDTLFTIENIIGSGFNDVFTGNALANTIDGGIGNDTVSYANSSAAVMVDLSLFTAQSGGDAAGDILRNIENVTGSGYDDVLAGTSTANAINGGNGNDTVSYAASNAGVTVNLASAAAQAGAGYAAGDILTSVENVTGSAYDDSLTAAATGSVLIGGLGNDSLYGGAGNDVLWGGLGNDYLDGGAGINTASYADSTTGIVINFGTGAGGGPVGRVIKIPAPPAGGGSTTGDTLVNIQNVIGSAFVDTLTADALNHVFIGGLGADVLTGGSHTTSSYVTSANAVSVNLLTNVNTGGDAQGDLLYGIQNLTGSNYNDSFTADANVNILDGGLGLDTVSYAGSAAAVNVNLSLATAQVGGNAAGDILINIENVIGSSGIDTLTGNAGDNVITGGMGADIINGGAGIDTVYYAGSAAGVMVNLLTNVNTGGDAQGDNLAGIENITGSANADTLTGNAGDNLISGGLGADIIDGGTGIDTVSYALSSAIAMNLLTNTNAGGEAAGDSLANIEKIIGSGYDDSFVCALAANILDGGNGIDTISYAGSAAVAVNLALAGAQSGGNAAGDILSNIENVTGSSNNDALTGNTADNVIMGGLGADIINGMAGIDTASYAGSASAVTINLLTNVNSGGDAQGDMLFNIENILGSGFNDVLAGNGFANIIDGGAGIDTLSYANSSAAVNVNLLLSTQSGGDAAGDILLNIENITGSGFDDVLTGNLAANVIDGGAGFDTVSYAGSNAGVTVNLSLGGTQGGSGHATGDVLTSIEQIIGSLYADTLTAAAGGSVLTGGAGNDGLYGGVGNDILSGGIGADYLDGGLGINTASYTDSSAAVYINFGPVAIGRPRFSGGDAEGDVLVNIHNVIGSAFADRLSGDGSERVFTGGAGADIIGGGTHTTSSYATSNSAVTVNLLTNVNTGGDAEGDQLFVQNLIGSNYNDSLTGDAQGNTLNGGSGRDILTGGDGADIFKYSSIADSGTIYGSHDVLTDFSATEGDKIDLAGFDGTFSFRGLNAFTGTAHEISYSVMGANIMINVDVDGDASTDFQIDLAGNHTLTASDFIL